MTELSEEILEKYQVRKTAKQKEEFIAFLSEKLPGLQVEEGGLVKSRNLILGDVDRARVVFSAHYDTCAVLPFPNFLTPKNIPVYILFNLLIVAVMFLLVFLVSYLIRTLTGSFEAAYFSGLAVCFGFLFLLVGGRPNRHTANDNTSGVVSLCELYSALTPEQREKAAFVFFDNEESGLFGSRFFLKRHKGQMKEKLLINLDCVSDGDYIMFIENKPARSAWGEALRAAFSQASGKTQLWEKSSTTLYPSDQAGFPCTMAVAAFNKGPLGLYLSRIHTSRDTVFQRENITFLTEGFAALVGMI